MSMKRGPWGQPGQRIYPTGGDPDKRQFESDVSERERQRKYARAEQRGGEHFLPGATMSLEAGERAFEQGQRDKCAGGFLFGLKMLWSTIIHMGMYSDDPTIARQAIVLTAREEIGRQRQITAANHATDQARDDERMAAMASHMARAIFDEAERRRDAS